MKQFVFYLLVAICVFPVTEIHAQTNGEDVLINRILICLQRAADSQYAALFPKGADLVAMAAAYQPETEEDARRIVNMIDNPAKLERYDPDYNHDIVKDFQAIVSKGKDSGLHWNDVLLARFELQKMRLPEDMVGFEKIATIRLGGFVYVKDMLTRRTYMIAITDVMNIGGKWYGGKVVNILEADNEEEYYKKLAAERKAIQFLLAQGPEYLDSIRNEAKKNKEQNIEEEEEDEEKTRKRTDIVERKLYTGTFDNEIPVELYMRSLKGNCPEGICAWEAMYRFGDMEYYIILEVTKSNTGVFSFTDEETGVMEIRLANQKFTGAWISFRDKTEYEVRLKEKEEIKSKKLFKLDSILESISYPED